MKPFLLADMHYFKFNIGDYAGHTQHLTAIEDLAYRRMLEAYYLAERPLNAGIASVARQIRMREFEAEITAVLHEFFALTTEGWKHGRADREIAEYHSKIEQASKAGKASAERRFNGRSTDVQPTTNHKPITIKQETGTKKQEPRGKNTGADAPPFIPPDWINLENWNAWHAGAKRKKATPEQKQVAVNILVKWRNAGFDYAGALENAAAGGYQGLFLPDGKPKGYVNRCDVAAVTVPSRQGIDPALAKVINDGLNACPPPESTRAKLKELRG